LKYSKKLAGAITATIIGLVLAWLLLRISVDGGNINQAISDILSRITGADTFPLIGAFLLFLLSQVFRAFRWLLLSCGQKYRFSLSMAVTAIHIGLGHLLPFRLADVAFVGLFRHFGKIPVGHGTANVFFAKLLDLMAMGVVIGFAVAGGMGKMALVAPFLVLAGYLGIYFMFPLLKLTEKPLKLFLNKILHTNRSHWFDDLLEASSVKGRRGKLASAFLVSILVWISKLLMFCFLLESLGITGIPLWKVFMASGVTNIIMSLPIHGLLSIGTVEAAWAAGFAMVGIEGLITTNMNIIELGFSVHIIWMLMAIILMILAIPLLWYDSRSRGRVHEITRKERI